jgi:hypothetical protein
VIIKPGWCRWASFAVKSFRKPFEADFAFASFRNRRSFQSNRSARAFVFVAGSAPQPWVSRLGHFEPNPAKVERLATDVIELSTRNQFAS